MAVTRTIRKTRADGVTQRYHVAHVQVSGVSADDIIAASEARRMAAETALRGSGPKGNKFNGAGFDRRGYDRYGTRRNGRNREGFDQMGWNRRRSVNEFTGTKFDPYGYDSDGFDSEGYDYSGWGHRGVNRETGTKRDREGLSRRRFYRLGRHLDPQAGKART